MLNLDSKAIRFLARMGARGCLGQAVYDYARDGKDFFALSADLSHASGFDRLKCEFPEKFVNVGIAEQNLIGISAGLAYMGLPVIATTWAMFAVVRAADQVRNFMGFMQKNIKLVGMDSGFAQSRFGYSHSNPPDIAFMRCIPGVVILSPCDGIEIYKAIYAAMEFDGPVYIRLTGGQSLPMIHKNPEFEYKIGKAITLCDGTDVAIVATGNAVKNALAACKALNEHGISVKVIDMHTIHPLDTGILDTMKNMQLIVTVEEHLKNGGMGSAVAEYYSSYGIKARQIIMGVDDYYPNPGQMEYIEKNTGISAEQIVETILREIR